MEEIVLSKNEDAVFRDSDIRMNRLHAEKLDEDEQEERIRIMKGFYGFSVRVWIFLSRSVVEFWFLYIRTIIIILVTSLSFISLYLNDHTIVESFNLGNFAGLLTAAGLIVLDHLRVLAEDISMDTAPRYLIACCSKRHFSLIVILYSFVLVFLAAFLITTAIVIQSDCSNDFCNEITGNIGKVEIRN